jgi:hypothetical protein
MDAHFPLPAGCPQRLWQRRHECRVHLLLSRQIQGIQLEQGLLKAGLAVPPLMEGKRLERAQASVAKFRVTTGVRQPSVEALSAFGTLLNENAAPWP